MSDFAHPRIRMRVNIQNRFFSHVIKFIVKLYMICIYTYIPVAFSPYVLSVRRTPKNNAIDIFSIYIAQSLKIFAKTLIFFHKIATLYSKMQEY